MTPPQAPLACPGRIPLLSFIVWLALVTFTACATTAGVGNASTFRNRDVAKSVQFLQAGRASYYANKFKNRRTANGERYNPDALTAAHPKAPFGTLLLVKRKRTGRYVVVRVNDRGPHIRGRILDLSTAAARKLGILSSGVAEVEVYKVDPKSAYASLL